MDKLEKAKKERTKVSDAPGVDMVCGGGMDGGGGLLWGGLWGDGLGV